MASIETRHILTPSQLNRAVRGLIEDALPLIWIEGELSNLARPASGHLYFSLKDAGAQVRCAMFRPRAVLVRFKPSDGAQVLARARVSLYEPRGDYQLIIEHLEEAGEGALKRAFEALKQRLNAEGLFEQARKRPLPALIRRLAVITSPSGAAIRDVLSVIARRWPLLDVEVLPTPVQGADAAAALTAMLNAASASGRYDAILLTRGGGSLEDLNAFNDEALARAIAAASVPVISAVGHEIDFSIADFVADLRAPTPSAAAELLTPAREHLGAHLEQLARASQRALRRRLTDHAQRVDLAAARLRAAHPAQRLRSFRATLDQLGPRLRQAALAGLNASRQRLNPARLALAQAHPAARIGSLRDRLAASARALTVAISVQQRERREALNLLARTLHAVSPLATLERGYVIVRDPIGGRALKRAQDLVSGQAVQLRFADGERLAEIADPPTATDPPSGKHPAWPPRSGDDRP